MWIWIFFNSTNIIYPACLTTKITNAAAYAYFPNNYTLLGCKWPSNRSTMHEKDSCYERSRCDHYRSCIFIYTGITLTTIYRDGTMRVITVFAMVAFLLNDYSTLWDYYRYILLLLPLLPLPPLPPLPPLRCCDVGGCICTYNYNC